jgi:hypothetical protein
MLETVLEIGVVDEELIYVAQDTDCYESLLTCWVQMFSAKPEVVWLFASQETELHKITFMLFMDDLCS